jgi:CheY-like chemotaxis protein
MPGEKILVVSYDRALLRTRTMLLRSGGYQVLMADSVAGTLETCRKISLDLVIIGHSIPRKDQTELSAIIRQECPGVPVLLIIRSELEPSPADVEYIVNAQDGPGVLLHTVNSILRPQGKSKQYA